MTTFLFVLSRYFMLAMDILPTLRNGLDASSSNLYVKGLPSSIDEEALVDIFSRFGDIRSCHILPNTRPGATNIGYVHLGSPEQARDAISALNGASTERGVLEVRPSPPASGRNHRPLRCTNVRIPARCPYRRLQSIEQGLQAAIP